MTGSRGSQRTACGRCCEVIVPSPHLIGTWVADRPPPEIGEPGQRPGLCPDGERHQPRAAGQDDERP